MTPVSYSVRRLAPFRGVLHVLRTDEGRAVTTDGVNWQIQLWRRCRIPQWGGLGEDEQRWGYLVAGVWNRQAGRTGFPVDPEADSATIDKVSNRFAQYLDSDRWRTPFSPADHWELWLLDRRHRPLALLASARDVSTCERVREIKWQPTLAGDLDFRSASLASDAGFARSLAKSSPHHRDAVANLVLAAAHSPPQAQWFLRDKNGSGQGHGGIRLARRRREDSCRPQHFRS